MALWLLGPDPDGNCCDCTGRTSPCDSCGEPVLGCAMFIPFASSYNSLTDAQTALADRVYDCYFYYGGTNDTFTSDLSVSNAITMSSTTSATNSSSSAGEYSMVTIGGGTVSIAYNINGSGGTSSGRKTAVNIAIFTDTFVLVEQFEDFVTDGVVSGTFVSSVLTEGTYLILTQGHRIYGVTPANTTVSSVFTISSSALVALPVIALYDDSGITRQLEACPKMLLPPLTESTGNWYASEATAQAVINGQTSNCIGWANVFDTLSVTSDSGGVRTQFTSSVSALGDSGSIDTVCYFSVNLLAGAILTYAGTLDYSSVTGCVTSVAVGISIFSSEWLLIDAKQTSFISNIMPGPPASLTYSLSSSSIVYSGRYIIAVGISHTSLCSGTHTVTVNNLTTSSSALTVNQIQALYATTPLLDCPKRLDC